MKDQKSKLGTSNQGVIEDRLGSKSGYAGKALQQRALPTENGKFGEVDC